MKKLQAYIGIKVIINSLIWAAVMIICSLLLGDDYRKISNIILMAATLNLGLFSSNICFPKKAHAKEDL